VSNVSVGHNVGPVEGSVSTKPRYQENRIKSYVASALLVDGKTVRGKALLQRKANQPPQSAGAVEFGGKCAGSMFTVNRARPDANVAASAFSGDETAILRIDCNRPVNGPPRSLDVSSPESLAGRIETSDKGVQAITGRVGEHYIIAEIAGVINAARNITASGRVGGDSDGGHCVDPLNRPRPENVAVAVVFCKKCVGAIAL